MKSLALNGLVVAAVFLGCLLRAGAASAQEAMPESEMLRARIEQLVTDPDARAFGAQVVSRRALPALYEHRGFTRIWRSETSDELLRAIRDSAGDGLDPDDYLSTALESARAELAAGGAPLEAELDYDVIQTEALIRLLYHLIFGKVDPSDFDPQWNFTREVDDLEPSEFLSELLDSGALYERIEAQKPQHDFYRRLRAELARQRERAAGGEPPRVPEGPKLELGSSGPRVAALRTRLAAAGEGDVFDAPLADAVKAFQRRHGLDADGIVGPGTLAELNVPLGARIDQVRVNLERARWYLHGMAPTFVIVNVAGFEVYYLRDRKLVWSSRAMVGKPFRATPIFRSEITYLVLNPTWTVPPGILANDVLPAQRRNPSYLARKGLQVIDRNGRAVPTASIDWSSASARSFPYKLVQGPGPENALGRVKFMFPNSYLVYLHDTPSRSLFEKSERAFSSGCIRIENPLELAALLLEGQKGWDRPAIDAAIANGKTRTVSLEQPVPVMLAYWTAWVDQDGELELRRDVYGRDPKVLRALDAEFRLRR